MSLFTPNPIRISKGLIEGILVDKEFKRARASILSSTIYTPGKEFRTYSLLNNGCKG